MKASTLVGIALLAPAFLVLRVVDSQTVTQPSMATTSGFVVILIPGFPVASIVSGLMLGLAILVFVRKRMGHAYRVGHTRPSGAGAA